MIKFLLGIIALAIFTLAYGRHRHGPDYWKSRTFLGILKGIVLAVTIVGALAMLGGCTSVEVFAGIDQTKSVSPMCDPGGADDRATSNIGVRG